MSPALLGSSRRPRSRRHRLPTRAGVRPDPSCQSTASRCALADPPAPGTPKKGQSAAGLSGAGEGKGEERRKPREGAAPPGMPRERLQLQPRRPGRARGHPGAARCSAAAGKLGRDEAGKAARDALPNPAFLTCPEKGVHVRVRRSPFLRGPLRRVHDCWGTGQRSPGLQGGRGARRWLQNRGARGLEGGGGGSFEGPAGEAQPRLASPRSG